MSTTPPGKRPFYKYTSASTALAILKSGTVRYSSPLKFNDPFDVQAGLHFDFDLTTLLDKFLDRLHELAAASVEPPVDPEDIWGKVVLEARNHYPEHGFPRERWKKLAAELFDRQIQVIKSTQQDYQQHWWNTLLPSIRVFSVSEDRDNLLMWAHYARDHTGVVFEFWSLPDEDNPLSISRAVEYVDSPLPFMTEAELLDDMTGIKKLDMDALYKRYVYAKSKHWSYEREWRVWYPLAATGTYADMPIRQSEFKALYLGCRASPEFVKEALALVNTVFPDIRIFRANRCEDAYALEYTEL